MISSDFLYDYEYDPCTTLQCGGSTQVPSNVSVKKRLTGKWEGGRDEEANGDGEGGETLK